MFSILKKAYGNKGNFDNDDNKRKRSVYQMIIDIICSICLIIWFINDLLIELPSLVNTIIVVLLPGFPTDS
jgi:hypothetical protein